MWRHMAYLAIKKGDDYMKLNELNEKQQSINKNLERQIDSFFNKTNEKSFKTRDRYRDGMKDFGKFLAKEYRKENIKSIKNKHIQAYANHMQKNPGEYSRSYTTTNMSAIRFFYERTSEGRMHIRTNKEFGIQPRTKEDRLGKDRSMKNEDYRDLLQNANAQGQYKYSQLLKLAKIFGLRLHESFSLRKSQINKGIKSGQLEIKGKGGLIRYLPINSKDIQVLRYIANASKTGIDRIFVEKKEKTHTEMKKFQNFIRESKKEGSKSTYHSLRHSYAQDLYKNLIQAGLSHNEAIKIVNQRLGHGPNRMDITRIYLQK